MTDKMLRHAAWLARNLGRGELSPFTDQDIRELVASIGVDRVTAGTRLMTAGRPVRYIGVIEKGDVELYRRSGTRRVMLQVLRAGDTFGDIPYFCGVDAPFDARAISDVVLIRLEDETLTRLLHTHPAICRRFLFSLAARLEKTQLRLLEVTAGDLRSQVASLLLDETQGRPGSIRLPQSILAELLGATRPSVNRVLKGLEADGLLHLTYRNIEVVDPGGLRSIAG